MAVYIYTHVYYKINMYVLLSIIFVAESTKCDAWKYLIDSTFFSLCMDACM